MKSETLHSSSTGLPVQNNAGICATRLANFLIPLRTKHNSLRKFFIFLILLALSLSSTLTLSAQCTAGGPITTAPVLLADPGTTIDVPIKVSSFSNVGAISLTLNYDNSKMTFNSYLNTSGLIDFCDAAVSGSVGTITISGTPGSASLADNAVLITLKFNYVDGTSALTWNDNPSTLCEYGSVAPDFNPFCDTPKGSFYIDGSVQSSLLVHNLTKAINYKKIQAAIDAADANDIIVVDAGTFTERIEIGKPLTILGVTNATTKKDVSYVYNPTTGWSGLTGESIIVEPTGDVNSSVVHITSGGVTFKGFVVSNFKAYAGGTAAYLIHVDPTWNAANCGGYCSLPVVVENNVVGPLTNLSAQDGTKGRFGMRVDGHVYNPKALVQGNKIFDALGNGAGLFFFGQDNATGGTPNTDFSGCLINNNEITGNHRSGIEFAGGVNGFSITNNHIHLNGGKNVAEKTLLKYGNGVLFIHSNNDNYAFGTTHPIYNIVFTGNLIENNEKNGIYLGPFCYNISSSCDQLLNNGVLPLYNSWDGLRVDLTNSYYNPLTTYIPRPIDNISLVNTSIIGNGTGISVIETPSLGSVNAANNYWGGVGFCSSKSGAVTYFPYYTTIDSPPCTFGGLVYGNNITASASANPICAGTSTTISATGGSAYGWDNGLGLGSSKVISPASTTLYTVTGNDLFGCPGAVASVTVTVNSLPVVLIEGSANGSSLSVLGIPKDLNASGASSYLWSTTSTSNPISVAPTTPTTYWVIGTTGSCSASTTHTVNLANVTAGTNQTLCLGNSANLTATVVGVTPTSYSWTSTPAGFTSSLQNPVVTPVVTTVYTVVVNGIPDLHAHMTVFVNPVPVANAGAGITIATGGNGLLSGSASSGTPTYNYSWTTADGHIVSGALTATPVVDAAGTYTLSVTDANGCSSAPVSTTVIVAATGVTFSGNVAYAFNLTNNQMHNVTITLKQGSVIKYTTTTPSTGNGDFQILGVLDGVYTVYLSSPKPWGGVTAADIVLIQNHYKPVGAIPLIGIKRVAADVVANGTGAIVNVDDKNLINTKRITPTTPLTETGDWVFTKAGDILTDYSSGPYFYANSKGTSNISITIGGAPVSLEFRALCYGDVDASYTGLKETENTIVDFTASNGLDLINFPNPFSGKTTFRYTVPVEGSVTVMIHNLIGTPIATIVDPDNYEGEHKLSFDGQNLAPGLYLYTVKLKTSDDIIVQTGKMMIIK